jgi:hypothetical protein
LKASSAPAKSGAASSTTQPSDSKIERCASSAAVTRRSTGTPGIAPSQASRTPRKSRSSGRAKIEPGSSRLMGERGSGPATAESASATSAAVRAIMPSTEIVAQASRSDSLGTRPGVGRRPTTLQ